MGDCNVLDVFPFVVVSDLNIPSSRLEIDDVLLTKDLILDGEVLENNIVNVVVTVERAVVSY